MPKAALPPLPPLLGCDFSSSPSPRKPIVLAWGRLDADAQTVTLEGFHRFSTLVQWQAFLLQQPAWVGGFDLPFALPRELVNSLGWPSDWQACMQHYARLERSEIRDLFKAFCDARPVGGKFAHRATDGPAGASPSMKWVNPPVAWMLHAGLPRLLALGADFPGLLRRDSTRVALEAYPGMLARELIGRRSYKSDDRQRQTPERAQARAALLEALQQGRHRLGLRLLAEAPQLQTMAADASGDHLDAAICMLQAGWALAQHAAGDALYGLPPGIDPLEGWIVTAPLSRP
ncbi:DUF429 domain-containing protein [Comamonas piscis]|uniref:DUF429 domain-containing protein n=1 Tax=Comamonas piscis TaxID=1562974 RepID=A0A7G5EM96_9BURK|nr:DUF429 domain-containing protein [Comamonas piscis]QMV75121.1 DUF429 domain-containing protein [Comamonas piscis]WSO33606.1 DUF429 domain-containing protein [Comamonas piscis]